MRWSLLPVILLVFLGAAVSSDCAQAGTPAESSSPAESSTPAARPPKAASSAAAPSPTPVVEQDPQLLQLASGLLPYCPNSTFRLSAVEPHVTPSGAYRIVTVQRSCDVAFLSTPSTLIVDDAAGLVWEGTIGRLPTRQQGISGNQLRPYLSQFLPEVLERNLRMHTNVEWDGGDAKQGALIPFSLMVDSGYGLYRKPSAVTSDGDFLVLGSWVPLDSNPVADRLATLNSSPLVIWDHDVADAKVEIVEFSDFECPACKAKWPVIAKVMDHFKGKVRHGMVGYPLSTIHPWSFRAACANWCVAAQDPTKCLPLKELFYSLQKDMQLDLVGPTAVDFVTGHDLSEDEFQACFLKSPSIDAVDAQLSLGNSLGVAVTPTYFINGWKVQVPNEKWLTSMVERLLAGKTP
jgi:protein-disulfide isomerase